MIIPNKKINIPEINDSELINIGKKKLIECTKNAVVIPSKSIVVRTPIVKEILKIMLVKKPCFFLNRKPM
jgi:hypothetical protein